MKPFSEGLTKERDMEVKESLRAMSVRFLKHGKNWHIYRFIQGGVENILISTLPIKDVVCEYQISPREQNVQKWVDDHRVQDSEVKQT